MKEWNPEEFLREQAERKRNIEEEKKMIEKSGAWFAYNGDKIGQGRENAKAFLKSHPRIMADLEIQLRKEYGLKEDPYLEEVLAFVPEDEDMDLTVSLAEDAEE